MLLLDLGNSRLKWCIHGEPVHCAALGQYASLRAMLQAGMPARLASTAPPEARALLLEELHRAGVFPELVTARDQWRGLSLAYADPSRFGVDRWLALLAARARQPRGAVIVLSAGTALTGDAVSADGRHQGGYIAPGPGRAAASLPAALTGYAQFGEIAPGATSSACVSAGYTSLYMGALVLWRELFALPEATLFLTGGDRQFLVKICSAAGWEGIDSPHLVLDGLALL